MLKRLFFLLIVALTTAPAHATFYVWADGQADGITGAAYYSEYIESVNTIVAADRVLHSPNLSNAALGSSSSIGTLKAYAQADTPYFNLMGDTRGWARSQYSDVITVGGSGPVTLLFTMPTIGTFNAGSYNAVGSANLFVDTASAGLLLAYRERMFHGLSTIEIDSTSGQITVDPGTQIYLRGYLVTDARVINQDPNALMSGVDFSHTSESFIEVLTPGGTVSSESGHNYAPFSPGDVNCDVLVNNGDIDPFVLALTDSAAYTLQYQGCNIMNADINGDGLVNNGDIDAFVALLTGG
jgi:hypothetical protein